MHLLFCCIFDADSALNEWIIDVTYLDLLSDFFFKDTLFILKILFLLNHKIVLCDHAVIIDVMWQYSVIYFFLQNE